MQGINELLSEMCHTSLKVLGEPKNYLFADIMNMDDFDEAKEILRKVMPENEIDYLVSYALDRRSPYPEYDVQAIKVDKESGKQCKVIFIRYEGLMAYLLLFKKGLIAPSALATTINETKLQIRFPNLLNLLQNIPKKWYTYITGEDYKNPYPYHQGQTKWEGSCDTFLVDLFSDTKI